MAAYVEPGYWVAGYAVGDDDEVESDAPGIVCVSDESYECVIRDVAPRC